MWDIAQSVSAGERTILSDMYIQYCTYIAKAWLRGRSYVIRTKLGYVSLLMMGLNVNP